MVSVHSFKGAIEFIGINVDRARLVDMHEYLVSFVFDNLDLASFRNYKRNAIARDGCHVLRQPHSYSIRFSQFELKFRLLRFLLYDWYCFGFLRAEIDDRFHSESSTAFCFRALASMTI